MDSRWKDELYTSVGNTSQTIGNSGCGPACASMIVSSIKGDIKTNTMAELFVKYGFRSANNGTYWSAYRAIADEFDIEYEESTDFDKILNLLENNYYIITSCGNGLFTTGGHYIVLTGVKNNVLKIFDPYLYVGKFDTATRKGKVVTKGNTVYCTVQNFRDYANFKQFFCYKYENKKNYETGQRVLVKKSVNIVSNEGEQTLVDDGNSQFWVNSSAITDDEIYGIATICYKDADNYIVQLFSAQFWCNEKNFVQIIQ